MLKERGSLVEQTFCSPSDGEIMAQLGRGNTAFAGELYRRHGDRVYTFICKLLGRSAMSHAEDLTQDVFITVIKSAKKYDHQDKFRAWLFGVTIRITRKWQRRRWLYHSILGRNTNTPMAIAVPIVTEPESQTAYRQEITAAFEKLSRDQKEVLLLRVTEGLTGEEISKLLNISETAVWSRLKRAHQVLKGSVNMHSRPKYHQGKKNDRLSKYA